ncbi:paraquat-inducible protein A [Glycocaulis sp.]|uniref:paraquat-inducible protein A n=1 Tax=Glycocaulis sp. TaxID=1969725 RepID=UPI003D21F0A8
MDGREQTQGTDNPHGTGGAMARALLILGIILFPPGIMLPLFEAQSLIVFKVSYSILDTIAALIGAREPVLALLIATFSLGTPLLKVSMLIAIHRLSPSRVSPVAMRWIELLGKWSFTDVVVVALAIVIWSNEALSTAASQPGLWFFAASALSLMLASGVMARDLRERGMVGTAGGYE